jgi:biotin carboxyl carrier protein
MTRAFIIGESGREIAVRGRGPVYEVLEGERAERVEALALPDGRLSLLLKDGRQVCGRVSSRSPNEVEISTSRGVFKLSVMDPLRARLAASRDHAGALESESEEVRAMMPGRIVEVAVASGDSVEAGGLLLVLEAMKMQNELRATRSGLVTQCAVSPGQTVEAGALLLTIHTSPAGDVSSPDSMR